MINFHMDSCMPCYYCQRELGAGPPDLNDGGMFSVEGVRDMNDPWQVRVFHKICETRANASANTLKEGTV